MISCFYFSLLILGRDLFLFLFISRWRVFPSSEVLEILVRQAFGYKTRNIRKYMCKPPCFEQGARHGDTAGAVTKERIYGFPMEPEEASWIMLAVEEEKLRATTRLIGVPSRLSNRCPRS